MKLIDRMIAKAKVIKLASADNVFIISNETGKWMAEGKEFPSLEAAQEHIEGLLPDGDADLTLIINDLGPEDPEALEALAVPADWIDRMKEANLEWNRKRHEKEGQDKPPEKDRRLI